MIGEKTMDMMIGEIITDKVIGEAIIDKAKDWMITETIIGQIMEETQQRYRNRSESRETPRNYHRDNSRERCERSRDRQA